MLGSLKKLKCPEGACVYRQSDFLTDMGLEEDFLADVQTEWDLKISLALPEPVPPAFSERAKYVSLALEMV